MINYQFWLEISKLDEHKNQDMEDLLCDKMVKEGMGQTAGGYLSSIHSEKDRIAASQQLHFKHYYIDVYSRKDKLPSYSRLLCPQLMMYIAEVSGLKKQYLQDAFDFLCNLEREHGLKGKTKNGSYLRHIYVEQECALNVYKEKLRLYQINRILSNCVTFSQAFNKIGELQ